MTIFPRTYRQAAQVLGGWGPYCLTGIVANEYGVISLTAERVERVAIAGPALNLPEEYGNKQGGWGSRWASSSMTPPWPRSSAAPSPADRRKAQNRRSSLID